jgi:hypothetical protein
MKYLKTYEHNDSSFTPGFKVKDNKNKKSIKEPVYPGTSFYDVFVIAHKNNITYLAFDERFFMTKLEAEKILNDPTQISDKNLYVVVSLADYVSYVRQYAYDDGHQSGNEPGEY